MKLIHKNDLEYKNIDFEVKEVLKKFQEGYIKRDKTLVDSYMDELFAKDSNIVIVGTCDSEWCLGFEEAREIVDSDWQYWGDVRIDTENAEISTNGNIAWFVTEGSVKYSFEDSDEKYKRWLNSVLEYFDEKGDYANLSDKTKLAQINWMLSLFMSTRPDKKRSYKWPLRLTGVLEKKSDKWVFRYMQFCLPNKSDYPDVRFTSLEAFESEYKDSNSKLDEFKKVNKTYCSNEIKDILKSFQADYTVKDAEEFISKHFVTDDSISYSDMTEGTFYGASAIKSIVKVRKNEWDTLYLDSDRALTAVSDNTAWFTVSGYIKKSVREDAAIARQIENIKKIGNSDISPKDAMFKIRKEISLMYRETSKGDEYILPVRFEGVLLKENESFKFHSARFSYPYYWVIEGHYDTDVEPSEKGE
jgi:hypothetical protein